VRTGDGKVMEEVLVAIGCTVHDPDDLGETRWQNEDADDHEREGWTCTCGGEVVWVDGDGYRCEECDQPYNDDGTIYEEGTE